MTPTLLRALVLFLAAQTCILASGFLMFAMIGEINRRVSDQERISYLVGHFGKYRRILREYRRLYPGGRLRLYFLISFSSAMALLMACAWIVGFFR